MLWAKRIGLVSGKTTTDAVGNQIESDETREVFANVINITATERIALTQEAGFKGLLDIRRFEVYEREYDFEPYVIYADKKYTVWAIQPKHEKVWLTCRRLISDV
ncbi:MAG: hypothetical protein LBU07_05095 [Coriobacteriales bacterium]|jgi:hypothetical protein|nr:hypothetical protein [Coriobacteriales bacterium]